MPVARLDGIESHLQNYLGYNFMQPANFSRGRAPEMLGQFLNLGIS
jgi:hypothetical protein